MRTGTGAEGRIDDLAAVLGTSLTPAQHYTQTRKYVATVTATSYPSSLLNLQIAITSGSWPRSSTLSTITAAAPTMTIPLLANELCPVTVTPLAAGMVCSKAPTIQVTTSDATFTIRCFRDGWNVTHPVNTIFDSLHFSVFDDHFFFFFFFFR
jgi:hypothetical protein